MSKEIKNIAVIGSGISGIVASYLLQDRYDVNLFEKNNYIGGHTNTIRVKEGESGLPVDTGFIVFNDRTYPVFTRFLSRLGVSSQDSDMSFSYYNKAKNVMYSSDVPNGLFADRRNIVNLSFYRMFADIARFNKTAKKDFEEGRLGEITLGEYLQRGQYGEPFINYYFVPAAAAIWSAPSAKIMDFPCETFIRFYKNHGILDLGLGVQWKTIAGGSQTYVRAFLESFKGTVHTSRGAVGIERKDKVNIYLSDGSLRAYDAVVIAAHADQALNLLKDPTDREKRLLGPWRYSKNDTVLHKDKGRMPRSMRAWTSWNYIQDEKGDAESPVSLTYYMNRLQRLRSKDKYFVSLNQSNMIQRDKVVYETVYEHPRYDFSSMNTQPDLDSLNGVNNTYFCGSYFGYGFHEDGARSAVLACEKLGVSL